MEILNISKVESLYLVDYTTATGNKYARISDSQFINFIERQGYNENADPETGEYYIQATETTIERRGLTDLLTRYIEFTRFGNTFDTMLNDKNGNRIFVEVFYRIIGFRVVELILSDENQTVLDFSTFSTPQQFEIHAQIFEHKGISLQNGILVQAIG